MNMNQFTRKSLEAIKNAQDIANQHGNQQIEQCHLLLSLADQQDGFIPQLLTNMGLPLEIVGMIAGIFRLIDMANTTFNVTGDVVTTMVVARSENMITPPAAVAAKK